MTNSKTLVLTAIQIIHEAAPQGYERLHPSGISSCIPACVLPTTQHHQFGKQPSKLQEIACWVADWPESG